MPFSEQETENALYWLLQLFTVANREGWEDGPTEIEIRDNVKDFLANAGLCPYSHEPAVKRFFADVEKRGERFRFDTDMGGWADVLATPDKDDDQ